MEFQVLMLKMLNQLIKISEDALIVLLVPLVHMDLLVEMGHEECVVPLGKQGKKAHQGVLVLLENMVILVQQGRLVELGHKGSWANLQPQ